MLPSIWVAVVRCPRDVVLDERPPLEQGDLGHLRSDVDADHVATDRLAPPLPAALRPSVRPGPDRGEPPVRSRHPVPWRRRARWPCPSPSRPRWRPHLRRPSSVVGAGVPRPSDPGCPSRGHCAVDAPSAPLPADDGNRRRRRTCRTRVTDLRALGGRGRAGHRSGCHRPFGSGLAGPLRGASDAVLCAAGPGGRGGPVGSGGPSPPGAPSATEAPSAPEAAPESEAVAAPVRLLPRPPRVPRRRRFCPPHRSDPVTPVRRRRHYHRRRDGYRTERTHRLRDGLQ